MKDLKFIHLEKMVMVNGQRDIEHLEFPNNVYEEDDIDLGMSMDFVHNIVSYSEFLMLVILLCHFGRNISSQLK